jgi:protein-S-isoprenylcysteine O-methyltransferase Ste14
MQAGGRSERRDKHRPRRARTGCARLKYVGLFIQSDSAARGLVIGTVAVSVIAESWATYLGQTASSSSISARLRTLVESISRTLVPRNRGDAPTSDRGTKRTLVAGVVAGGVVAVETATRIPAARWGSNGWFGVVLGTVIALARIALRTWAVKTLGRYFQREVVIEAGQQIVRSGPYRWIRHPAYSGNLLALFGFGVAVGSWLGAVLGTLLALLAHLPRINVEEGVLRRAFGEPYVRYAATTARPFQGCGRRSPAIQTAHF